MVVVVGAGLSGVVLAERLASVRGQRVVVVEKRPHVGGNCHDFVNPAGHLVPTYGPHFFHTNSERVWKYLSEFTSWHPYEHRVLSRVDGMLVPVPVNITTVNRLFGLELQTRAEMEAWLQNQVVPIEHPQNSEESSLARVGPVLYEKMFRNYTKKQWDLYPHELDPLVMNRIPVRSDFEDRYFTDRFQAMPSEGYTKLIEKMLDHPQIEVCLSTDYTQVQAELASAEKIFFTGRIDEYFPEIDERLQYRSLRFEVETLDQEWFQPVGTVNYPNEETFTRISEPKHSTGQASATTTIIREYPSWEGEPYYPVFNKKNQELYARYQRLAEQEEARGVYFVGRLANYKYFNMDQAIENALGLFDRLFPERPIDE